MKLDQIYDNTIAEEDLDAAIDALLKVTRESLKLKPMQEVLVFLIAYMKSSDDANIDYHKMMRIIGGTEKTDLIQKMMGRLQ